jgi:hypothetical protein
MVTFDASNSHFEYMDVVCHWSPISQKYAGGDAINTLLNDGWRIQETVFFEEFWHAGSRPVTIFHFKLVRDDETLHVPVLSNPYVRRLVESLPLQVRPLNTSTQAASQRR